jgi:hypothetical protein
MYNICDHKGEFMFFLTLILSPVTALYYNLIYNRKHNLYHQKYPKEKRDKPIGDKVKYNLPEIL